MNPIANGTVTNWDALKKIFWHVFYTGLNIAPEEHPFVLAESPFTSTADREAIARLMFEEYSVPALDIVPDAVLVAYQAGCVTGLVIDVGNESARIVPVVEGKCLAQTARQVDLADLWNALASLLQNFDEGTQGKLCSSVILVRFVIYRRPYFVAATNQLSTFQSGGNQNPTIADELHDAIVGMVAGSISVKIINPAHREFSVWEGGTIVGSNCAFFSKEQYDEDDGASALNGKYYA